MVNRIQTIYPRGLNKGFCLKFCEGFQVWPEMPEKDWKMHQPKHCEFYDEDEDNSSNKIMNLLFILDNRFGISIHYLV